MDILAPLRFGWRQLTTPDRSMWGYIGRAWLVTFAGAILLYPLAFLFYATAADTREMVIPDAPLFVLWFGLGIAIPLVETAVQTAAIHLTRLLTKDWVMTASVIGVIAFGAHAFSNNLSNGVLAGWQFFAMTIAYQVAAQSGWWRGPVVAFVMHAMTNSLVVVLTAIETWSSYAPA